MAQRLYFGLSGLLILLAFLVVSSCGSKKAEIPKKVEIPKEAEVSKEAEIPKKAVFIDDFRGVPKLSSNQAKANQKIIDDYYKKKVLITELKKKDVAEKVELQAKKAEVEAIQQEFTQLVKEKIKDEKIRAMIANAKDADELEKILRENTNLTEAEIQELVKKKKLLVKKDKNLRLEALQKIYARLIRNQNLGVETAFCDAASSLDNFVISPIFYGTGVYSIEKKFANILFDNIDKIINALDAYPKMLLQTEGNCDERGSNVYNKNLGDYRWTGTVPLLVSMQFEKSRIRGISKGEECAVERSASMDKYTWWSKNRRTDFTWILDN